MVKYDLSDSESEPQRAKPGDQETAESRDGQPRQLDLEKLGRHCEDHCHDGSERSTVARSKSGVKEAQVSVVPSLHHRRAPEPILPRFVKRFLGVLFSAVKPEDQSGFPKFHGMRRDDIRDASGPESRGHLYCAWQQTPVARISPPLEPQMIPFRAARTVIRLKPWLKWRRRFM
ncbi:MAG: hypothetical protein HYS04_04525 [Acidobacteria bacterium]|nr:hypothetical protein [Acidobacteriota bacterium]